MINKKRWGLSLLVGSAAAALILAVVSALPASAASKGDLLRKAALSGLYGCYNSGAYKDNFAQNDYMNAKWLVANADAHTTYLPNGMTEADGNKVNCDEVLNGKKEGFWSPKTTFAGLYSLYSKSTPINTSSPQTISTYLKGMGYDSSSQSSGKCIQFKYSRRTTDTSSALVPDGTGTDTTTICADQVSGGKIAVDEMAVAYQRSTGGGATNSGSSEVMKLKASSGKVVCQTAYVNWLGLVSWKDVATINFQNGSTTWDDFQSQLLSSGCAPESLNYLVSTTQYTFSREEISYPPSSQVTTQMNLADDAGERAIKYLSGLSYDSLKLTPEEKRTLLQYYMDEYYKIEKRCNLTKQSDIDTAVGDGFEPAAIVDNGKAALCYIKPTAHKDDSVYVWDSNDMLGGNNFTNGFKGLVGMLDYQLEQYKEERKQSCIDAAESERSAAQSLLNQSTTSEEYREKARKTIEELDQILSDHGEYWYESGDDILCYEFTGVNGQIVSPNPEPPIVDDGDDGDGNNNSEAEENPCTDAAGSLGWILCPVLNLVSEGVDEIYKGYIQKQFLEIDSTKLKADSSSDVYNGWKVIRDMANTIFVIMFMIVLFSQLTGIGLTNYGIKKMLPRLIVVAVLVNVSFLFCQFAVDISNILGYSMNALFEQMSNTVNNMSESFTADGGVTGTVMTWVGVLALAIGAGTIGSWLIPFLLVLLSSAISVFFGAIILGARQAGIFILVVIAPAAIVCYALPNAKTMFDRWFKMFTSLLMVFPICGALMGGGNFASNILLTASGSFFLTLVAMLLRVVPFFLIPGLIRSAFTAMGNIGAKIANVGNRVGRTATGSIARSDFVKRRDADLARLQGGATALRGRALSKITGKPMSDRRKAKIARQYSKYNKLKSEEAAANPYAMAPGSREYEAMKNAAHQNRIDNLAKNIALENTDIATDETALAEKHQAALAALNEDQSDENMAAVQAYQDMLITSDGGRTKMFDNYAQATIAGQDKGIELGAQHLLRNHTKDIKPNNRDFFSYLGEASRISSGGDIHQDSFQSFQDNKGNTHYLSNYFANQGVSSYDAASIAKMDEGSLDRLIEQAGSGALQDDQKRVLEQYTRQAMTSDTIHVQDKIATKFNTLRTKMGFQTISMDARNSTDSGTIQLHDNGGAGNNNGAGARNGGPVLRTGNDDRPGQRGPAPLPSPLRDAEDWRPNNDHGGIILPPGAS